MTFMHDLTNFMRLALIWTSNDRLLYQTTYRVAQKTGTLFRTPKLRPSQIL